MYGFDRYKDDIYLFNTGEAQRAYDVFGCHKTEEGYSFCVWAPNAKKVSVIGDFNGWDESTDIMENTNGVWHTHIKDAKQGDNYKFAIFCENGEKHIKADPFAVHSEARPGTASRVWSIDGYNWSDADFLRKRLNKKHHNLPMSIYELHLGSWRTKEGEKFTSVYGIAEELAEYLNDMGYTHVELLPIMEHPFDGSWGYQVTGYYCATSRYGSPQDYMHFVDVMHAHNIGVIMDWVPAHFPKDEHGLAKFDGTCLFEHADPLIGEQPQWGTLVFDFGKAEVQSFLISSALFWLEKYHIDGIRVDAVSAMLYLDFCREEGKSAKNIYGDNRNLEAIEFIKKLNATVHTLFKGVIMIAEESSAYKGVTADINKGGLGFDYKWNMGYMNDTLKYFSMDPVYRKYHHNLITFPMMYAQNEHFILPYSHDECVHGKKSMVDKLESEYSLKFANLRTLYGFMFAHPGKKLMFMGDEFAHFAEWDEKHELDWFLLQYVSHRQMKEYVRDLNRFYRKNRSLYELEESWEGFNWLVADDNENSVAAFMRISRARGGKKKRTVCLFNFTPVARYNYRIGIPLKGELELALSSDDIKYGGVGISYGFIATEEIEVNGFENSFEAILPPMSAVFYDFKETEDN